MPMSNERGKRKVASSTREELENGLTEYREESTVPEGVDVLLSHQEHGALLLSPGTYRIGTQREFAGEWRAVAD